MVNKLEELEYLKRRNRPLFLFIPLNSDVRILSIEVINIMVVVGLSLDLNLTMILLKR